MSEKDRSRKGEEGRGGERSEEERMWMWMWMWMHVSRYVYTGALWWIMFVMGVYALEPGEARLSDVKRPARSIRLRRMSLKLSER